MNYIKYSFMAILFSGIMFANAMVIPAHAAVVETPMVQDAINEGEAKVDESRWMNVVQKNILSSMFNEQIIAMALSEETEYVPRLEAPNGDNPYYHELNLFYNFGLGMPNCTAYAYGRAYEILGEEPNLSNGNAGRWWWENIATGAYAYGDEPKVGAVACWDDYNQYSGHVAVVEEINGSIVTISESQYGGEYFYVKEMSADGSDYLTGRRFLGYIYVGETAE